MAAPSSSPKDGRRRKSSKDTKAKDKGAGASEVQADIERLTALGHSALQQGGHAEALDCFKRALNAAVKAKETKAQRACAFNLGAAYVEAGKPQKGLELLLRAQPGERGSRVADLQFNLAVARDALGEPEQAGRHYLQAALLYRSQGDGGSEGDTCVRLARCRRGVEDWRGAVEMFQRAAESYRVAGMLDSAIFSLNEAVTVMLQRDLCPSDDIITLLTDCLEMSADVTDQETRGQVYNSLGLSFCRLRLFAEAVVCYEQALASGGPQQRAALLQNLGAAQNSLRWYQQALEHHREAAALHGSLGNRRAQGRCFSNLGFALCELGELEEAAESFLHAQQAFRDTGDTVGQWQACEGLGDIRLRRKDPEKATLYFKQALTLLSQSKDSAGSEQERIVSKLSDALQHSLALRQTAQRGPLPRRVALEHGIPRQRPRCGEMKTSERPPVQPSGRELQNGRVLEDGIQEETESGKMVSTAIYGQQDPLQDQMMSLTSDQMMSSTSDSHVRRPHAERQDYLTVLLGANRNLNNTHVKPDKNNQNHLHSPEISEQDGGESVKQQTVSERDREPPLVESSQTPLPLHAEQEGATPSHRKLRSRFCLVM